MALRVVRLERARGCPPCPRHARRTSRAGRGVRAGGAARTSRGSRAAPRSPARAGARRRGTARRSRGRLPHATPHGARARRRSSPTSPGRRRRSGSIDARERTEGEQRRGRVAARVRDEPARAARRARGARTTTRTARRREDARTRTRRRRPPARGSDGRRRGRRRSRAVGGSIAAARSCGRQTKTTSAPHESAASFVMNRGMRLQPLRPSRGSRAPAGSPASESDPERVQLERRMREHAVERLLTRVPGGADDRDGGHLGIMHIGRVSCIHRRCYGRRAGCYIARAVERVLVLNASYEPLNVCSLRRAHVLVWKGKAEVLESHGKPLRSSTSTFTRPARHPPRHVRPRAARRDEAHIPPRALRARRLEVRVLRLVRKPPDPRPRRPALTRRHLGLGERRHVVRAVQPSEGRSPARGDEHDAPHAASSRRRRFSSSASRPSTCPTSGGATSPGSKPQPQPRRAGQVEAATRP